MIFQEDKNGEDIEINFNDVGVHYIITGAIGISSLNAALALNSETYSITEEEYQAAYLYFQDKYKATYVGRFDFSDPEGPAFSWSTSTRRARFCGTGIKMKLKRLNAWHDNAFAVVIDDNDYFRLDVIEVKIKLDFWNSLKLIPRLMDGALDIIQAKSNMK